MQGTHMDNFHIEKFSITRRFSMPTLIEEKKPVVPVKYEFEYPEKSKLKGFLRNF